MNALTRGRAAVLTILLGVLVLATAGPTWVHAQTATALDPSVPVTVSGGSAAAAVDAAGLVLVAAGLALALVGRVARWIVLAVVAAAGVLVAASAVAVARNPADVAAAGAAETAGVTDLTAPATTTAWPWLCAAVGVLAVLAAVRVALASRSWKATSGRHERAGTPAPSGAVGDGVAAAGDDGEVDAHDTWDALTRGTDPTRPPGD